MSLSNNLLKRVLERLGFDGASANNLNGLQRLYRAWCLNVPFDNVRKMIALRKNDGLPLPGMDAEDFFENWLENGNGGTCWPMSNSFFELAISLGFEARRVTGLIRDLGIINHGSVKVRIGDQDWLADAPLLFNDVLPLTGDIFIGNDPVFPVEVEPDNGSHLIWICTPPGPAYFYCRLLNETVSHAFYKDRYEQSREKSIFNQRLYARLNYAGKLIILYGNTRYSKTAEGIETMVLSRDQVCNALRKEIGISDKLVNDWVHSGSLEASFEPASGSPPPTSSRKPPSQREFVD